MDELKDITTSWQCSCNYQTMVVDRADYVRVLKERNEWKGHAKTNMEAFQKLREAFDLAMGCLSRIDMDRGTNAGSTNARNFADRRDTEEKIKKVLA